MTSETTALVKEGSGAMFDGIAARYDFVNRVISLGIDQSWRRKSGNRLHTHSISFCGVPTSARCTNRLSYTRPRLVRPWRRAR